MFSQPTNKRQKLSKDSSRTAEGTDYFPGNYVIHNRLEINRVCINLYLPIGISKIEYKGTSAPYDDTLCYRYYNANERINGRTMEDWIKPALSLSAFKNTGK